MSLLDHFKWWFIIGITFLAVSLILSESKYDPIINAEVSQMERIFGKDIAQRLYDESIEIIMSCCGSMVEQVEAAKSAEGRENTVFSMTFILESIVKTFHIFILRLLSISMWTKWLVPFGLFMLIDAMVSRKIRSENLAWQSPLYYHFSMHGTVFTLGALIAYFLVPTSIMLWVIPFFLLLLISSLSVAIANFQRLT